MGEDVHMNDIVLSNDRNLVGHFSGRRKTEMGVNSWDKCTWLESVEVVPEVFVFPRG